MDYYETAKKIAETIASGSGISLTDDQLCILTGAFAVFLDKAIIDEREACARIADDMDYGPGEIGKCIRNRSK